MHILIEKNAQRSDLARDILKKIPNKKTTVITSAASPCIAGSVSDQKRSLLLAVNKGSAVREFRRMDGLVQRREYYIYFAQNCPLDCQYCFLQCYGGHAVPTVFVNQRKILREVETVLRNEAHPFFHTGELADSLVFDPLIDLNAKLTALFARYPNGRLELRTKCAEVSRITAATPAPNVTVSWTFTPDTVIRLYERGTPPLAARIRAAQKCQAAGYAVGLRLDPIVACADWEQTYEKMVRDIFSRLDHRKLESAVLGVFRYAPALEKVIKERFPKSDILINEFVPCVDGKMRYFKPLRIGIYRNIIGMIRRHAPNLKITLCMETPEVWESVFNK
jgi:spore photoproduct lyase